MTGALNHQQLFERITDRVLFDEFHAVFLTQI